MKALRTQQLLPVTLALCITDSMAKPQKGVLFIVTCFRVKILHFNPVLYSIACLVYRQTDVPTDSVDGMFECLKAAFQDIGDDLHFN